MIKVFFFIALGCFIAGAIITVHLRRKRNYFGKRVLLAAGITTFVVLLLLLYPLSYSFYHAYVGTPGSFGHVLLSLLLAVQNTLRTFILDGAWSDWAELLRNQTAPGWNTAYSIFGIIMSVIAPALTFGTIIAALASIFESLKFALAGLTKKELVIMSELNEQSLTLAKSILNSQGTKNLRIIFTDVFTEEKESNYELRTAAKELNAIMLKKDIASVKTKAGRGGRTFFLLGRDEAENMKQALYLYQRFKDSKRVKLFVRAEQEGNAVLLDSLVRGGILDETPKIKGIIENRGTQKEQEKKKQKELEIQLERGEFLLLRRIDTPMKLAWNQMAKEEMDLLGKALDGKQTKKAPNVLIAGGGSHGEAFLKTITWFCQMENIIPEVTVIDKVSYQKGSGAELPLSERLWGSCPELMLNNNNMVDGEAKYSLAFFEGLDIFGPELTRAFYYKEQQKEEKQKEEKQELTEEETNLRTRLKNVNYVIVALGDDDTNIAAAIHLRKLFSHMGRDPQSPEIYAIVFDDAKAMRDPKETTERDKIFRGLITYDGGEYNIRYIGNNSSVYDYKNLYDHELEQESLKYHTAWVKELEDQAIRDQQTDDPQKKAQAEMDEINTIIEMENNLRSYEQKEYYRLSSISKAMHKKRLEELDAFSEKGQEEAAERKRRVEHARWNAYMRTNGFSYGEKRNTLSKQHPCLVGFDELAPDEKRKD